MLSREQFIQKLEQIQTSTIWVVNTGLYMSTISMKISETIEGNCVHTNIQEVSELPGFLFKDSLSTI